MSLQWSQPLNLSQVLVYSLGCEHGRRRNLKHIDVIKYFKSVERSYMYMLLTFFFSQKGEKFIRFQEKCGLYCENYGYNLVIPCI